MMLTILKLGGSVLTYKKGSGAVNFDNINQLAKEIKIGLKHHPQKLILVAGAGGQAHALAKSYGLKDGALTKEKILASFKTHQLVALLRENVAEIFNQLGLAVFPLQTNSMFYTKNGKLIFDGVKIIKEILEQGRIPLLHGDMIYNAQKNFSILSGDTIILELAKKFKANKILFATDVDGVYTSNPHQNQSAQLLPKLDSLTLNKIVSQLSKANSQDATGEMYGKLKNLLGLAKGASIKIFNGLKTGNMKNAFLGKNIGTIIKL